MPNKDVAMRIITMIALLPIFCSPITNATDHPSYHQHHHPHTNQYQHHTHHYPGHHNTCLECQKQMHEPSWKSFVRGFKMGALGGAFGYAGIRLTKKGNKLVPGALGFLGGSLLLLNESASTTKQINWLEQGAGKVVGFALMLIFLKNVGGWPKQ